MTYDISVIIKCKNEANRITKCLTSVLEATYGISTEIIVVDSLSTDRTVSLAKTFESIRVIQFSRLEDCRCGSAVQLGYQCSTGDLIYVLDGDMELEPGFLAIARSILNEDANIGGVGGKIVDLRIKTLDDHRRGNNLIFDAQARFVSDLAGGGLYRRSSVERVGYLGHLGLPACEEAELGARLISAGLRLLQLGNVAAHHLGHNETDLQTLTRKWNGKRFAAYGWLLRDSFLKPWRNQIVKRIWFVLYAPLVHLFALFIALVYTQFPFANRNLTPLIYIAVWICILLMVSFRRRSLYRGLLSTVTWHYYAVGVAIGVFHSLPDPYGAIEYREIQ